MRPIPNTTPWLTLLLCAVFFALLVTEVAREVPADGPCRTEPIRRNLARLRAVLFTVERHLESVHELNETDQIALMRSSVDLLKDYLLPHLEAEEAVLYPAADSRLPGTGTRLTEALKKEHEILRRWLEEMDRLADAPVPDHNAFARRGERLLGLIEAHFEVDESILLPVLDEAPPLTRGAP